MYGSILPSLVIRRHKCKAKHSHEMGTNPDFRYLCWSCDSTFCVVALILAEGSSELGTLCICPCQLAGPIRALHHCAAPGTSVAPLWQMASSGQAQVAAEWRIVPGTPSRERHSNFTLRAFSIMGSLTIGGIGVVRILNRTPRVGSTNTRALCKMNLL